MSKYRTGKRTACAAKLAPPAGSTEESLRAAASPASGQQESRKDAGTRDQEFSGSAGASERMEGVEERTSAGESSTRTALRKTTRGGLSSRTSEQESR